MIRLVKGAKETFGWVVVNIDRIIPIPLLAWERYGFQVGEQAIFLLGSRKSGGFGLSDHRLLNGLSIPIKDERLLGWSQFVRPCQVHLTLSVPVEAGDQLISVYGSRYALSFITRGPIYDRAIQHPELEIFNRSNHDN